MKLLRIAALASLVVLLLLGAQALGKGKDYTYSGPLSETGPPQPTINLYLHFQRHRDGRLTIKITNTVILDAYYKCSDGNEYAPGSTGGNRSKLTFTERTKLKKRKFSRNLFEESAEVTAKIAGKVPKRGAAHGTLRLTASPGPPLGDCDSGPLTWSAARQ